MTFRPWSSRRENSQSTKARGRTRRLGSLWLRSDGEHSEMRFILGTSPAQCMSLVKSDTPKDVSTSTTE